MQLASVDGTALLFYICASGMGTVAGGFRTNVDTDFLRGNLLVVERSTQGRLTWNEETGMMG